MTIPGNRTEFHFSRHFEQQMVSREFNRDIISYIFGQADDHYYDTTEGTFAAVKSMLHKGAIRDILLVYRVDNDGSIVLITIHPLRPNQKERRIQSSRWISG